MTPAEPGEPREPPHSAAGPFRAVLLVGAMASGKTTVGARVAAELGWDFLDIDERVEAETGCTIAALFRERGEAAFRTLEHQATVRALGGDSVVIATGGGWPATPGRMESLPDHVLSVWLGSTAATSVERARRQPGVRPLLDVPDPEGRAAALLRERHPFYSRAALHLDTDGTSPALLAAAIVDVVRASHE